MVAANHLLLDETIWNVGHVYKSFLEPLCRLFSPCTGNQAGTHFKAGIVLTKKAPWSVPWPNRYTADSTKSTNGTFPSRTG